MFLDSFHFRSIFCYHLLSDVTGRASDSTVALPSKATAVVRFIARSEGSYILALPPMLA